MGNNALSMNPTTSNIDITTHASDWLWAVFCVMIVSAIGLLVLGAMQPVGRRAFHHLGAALCFTASIAYFCMASDLGSTPIAVEFVRGGTLGADWVAQGVTDPTRSIWYARYIDWVVTTPMLLLELLLSTGLPLSEIFTAVFFDEVMIITGLIGALISSQYKWGLFAFGCAAEIYIWYVLLGPARASATRLGPDFKKAYLGSAAVLSFLWLLYPVCWGLSDGGNVIKPTSEMVFYGVLDVLAKPVFCFYHCFAMQKCNYERLGFSSGKFSDGLTEEELLANEKFVGAPVGAGRHNYGNTATTGMVQTPNTPRESTATRVEAGAEQHAAGHPQFKPVNA